MNKKDSFQFEKEFGMSFDKAMEENMSMFDDMYNTDGTYREKEDTDEITYNTLVESGMFSEEEARKILL